MLALEAARAHGIAVNEAAAQAAAERTFRYLADIDAAARIDQLIDPGLFGGYSLLAAHAAGVTRNLSTGLYARHIARAQHRDGYWATLDGRPPHSAGRFATTAVAARAIDLYLPDSSAGEKAERRDRARGWLQSAVPESTEDLTYRLLGLLWTGAGEAVRQPAAEALLSVQRADGGWAQVPAMPQSDAYSTAQALVALRRAGGVETTSTAWRRGIDWLLRTQAADGSWQVESRIHTPAPISPPYFESGFPYGHDQYVSCAATAWAVMALGEGLAPAKAPARPLALRGVVPQAAAWMETAAFGTPSAVAKLDPALATAGGTTVLMLAADHPEKVRALLARGAKPNATAASGYDALLTASLFGGNRATLELLLQAGATAKARQRVRFDAAPLNVVLFTGDTAMLRLLLQHGADPKRPFRLLGQFPASPLSVAAQRDDAESLRVLFEGGARLDQADPDGLTELSWAALNHKDAAIRALLALGANREVKDRFGLTPLDHTKAIRYSSAEAERLLRAGQ